MSKKSNWDVFTLDNMYHLLGGAAIAGLFVFVSILTNAPWLEFIGIGIGISVGPIRELTQHIYKTPIWNKHRIVEALAWGTGTLPFLIPLILSF